MGKEKPLVSVIIPVYNMQDYLKACIESVQNQTYPNLEILLVDDGSTDRSGALCEEYAAQDERIRVFHKENGGLSDARNMGLMEAHGEFLAFVDSDDLLAPKAVETLETLCETSNAEAAIGQVSAFAGHCTFAEESAQGEVIPMKEAMRRMLLHQKIGHEAWGKLYRRSLWQTMKFPVGLLYEDYAAIYRVIAQCRNVAIAPIPLYYYRGAQRLDHAQRHPAEKSRAAGHQLGRDRFHCAGNSRAARRGRLSSACDLSETVERNYGWRLL